MACKSQSLRFTLVDLPPLIASIIEGCIRELSTYNKVHTCHSIENMNSGTDFFVVSEDEFLRHLQFYLPRKQHLLIFQCREKRVENLRRSDLNLITLSNDIFDIRNLLEKIIKDCSHDNVSSTELTPREKDVLCLLSSGKTIKEIATELNISVNTTLTHRKNISAKLGIRSVSGLSLYAMMNGLL